MDEEGKLSDGQMASVKAVISSYRERIVEEANPAIKRFPTTCPEKAYAKTRELHRAMRDTNHLSESRKQAETATTKAQTELAVAKQRVKDLTQRIEESNTRAKVQTMKETVRGERKMMVTLVNPQGIAIARELESVKRELSKLKLDIASILEGKRHAEKETDDSLSRMRSYTASVDALNREIEAANEEHVLVELARIEAVKEYEQVEAQRREKAAEYTTAIKETREKKQGLVREIEEIEELEKKYAITVLDASVLSNELRLIKEMDKWLENDVADCWGDGAIVALEAAKKEFATVREESFQFMSSLDVVRNKYECVRDEVARMKRDEKKTETLIQSLNTKLLRAKARLEAAAAAEEKEKSIVSNLSITLEQLKLEGEATRKECAAIEEETAAVKAEVTRAESAINSAEDQLQIVLQELKDAKMSEAAGLEDLRVLTERTMTRRASDASCSSKIMISRFEYEYLTGQAAGAKEIADKKVAAAHAWVEALSASTKEIEARCTVLRREAEELKVPNVYKVDEDDSKESTDNEFEKWRRSMESKSEGVVVKSSKGKNWSVKMGPGRRGKGRRSSVTGMPRGISRSSSVTMRRRRKVIGNLAKLFGRKSHERNLENK